MGLLSFLKKKEIPKELPELAIDSIGEKTENKKDSLEVSKQDINNIKQELSPKKEENEVIKIESEKNIEETTEQIKEKKIEDTYPEITVLDKEPEKIKETYNIPETIIPIKESQIDFKTRNKENNTSDEKRFFVDLEKDLNHEISDLNKVEGWYKNKFLPRDIVSEMREHWEKKKNDTVIKILGKDFHERISKKTQRLQELEKEWQEIYFDIIEKEEEIRENEIELKKMLSEFVELCKRKEKENKK